MRSATEVEVVFGGRVVGGSSAAAILDHDGPGLPEERVGTVAAAVLSAVQDEICEALAQPWPVENGRMLNPDARQSGGHVEMWFGDESTDALRLRPLDIAL
ncbi:MAG: hypothetical protein M3Z25_00510 [Actinomycetota bacterium]|nr:hypothetical protein [Actinomycetota bacterium]